ncbi:unnamed protein product [Ceratitis capitata]|uniref:(Mediterranean fruit fly) hypothetical protein n=1 Tax=Ceratitis capitata TaxID=7213 RepID=A0A811V7Z5_CERCA|nr:unnamed protein product [Ceratitis capitata]
MAFEYLAYDLSQDEEVSYPSSLDRSLRREAEDPFHLDATEFRQLYRLTPDLVEEVVSQLDCQLKGRRITALSTEKQVIIYVFNIFFSLNTIKIFEGSNRLAIFCN